MNLEDLSINVSPLEGIVILKLISFSEKPVRKKDLDDISEILNNYFELNSERLYSDHLDITDEVENENFMLLTSARLLGRDMSVILSQSSDLNSTIEKIIRAEIAEEAGSITQYFLSQGYLNDHDLIKSVFEQILKGLRDS